MSWTKVYDITPLGVDVRRLWTRAIVQNELFLFAQGNPFILTVDTSTPGTVLIVENVDTGAFLNLAAVEGIFEARSRLGYWDSDNSQGWGDTSDTLDFTPNLRTRANTVKADAVRGNIIMVLGSTEGFITYTTANMVGATYDGTAQKVFNFFEVADNLGIFSDYSLTRANDGTHYAFTNGGLYQVTNKRNGAVPFATEVADYLTSFQQAPRLSFHLNRYLAVWLHDEQVEFARTIRQKNFSDAATYWRQQFAYDPEYLNLQALFLEALAPDSGYPITDGYPLGCYPEVPLANCFPESSDHTLWGMVTQEIPIFELEKMQVTVREYDDSLGATNFVDRYINPLDATKEQIVADPYVTNVYTPTLASFADIAQNHKGYTTSVLVRYSFDSHELSMYQCYLWQAEDNLNLEHLQAEAIMVADDMTTVNPQWEHTVTFRDAAIVNVSDTTVVDPDIAEDSRTGVFETSTVLLASGLEWETINARIVEIETFATKERQTIIDTFTIRHDVIPVFTVESPGDAGARDGEIISGPTVIPISIPANSFTQGLQYLAELLVGEWEADIIFRTNYYDIQEVLDGNGEITDPQRGNQAIFALGTRDYPSGWNPNVWSTASTLAATTDRCTYANNRQFTKNRATTDTVLTRTFTDRLLYAGDDDNGDSIYIHERTQDLLYEYDVDNLFPDLLNEPGVNITLKAEVDGVPLALITNAAGALPAAIIKPYYNDSVALGISLSQVYANNGWLVEPPYSAPPFSPPDFLQAAPPTGNWYNGTDPSGTFLEYFQFLLQCGRAGRGTWPFAIPEFPEPFVVPTLPDLTGPETIFLTQTGAPGQYYPIWDRVLVFDRHLQMWGTCDVPLAVFMDFSPVNEVTYDPVQEEFVTRFTYDNFLSRLGAVLENGTTVMWDDAPSDSYLVYGKIGWRRSLLTTMSEIFMEFAENPNANIILESSLDRRTLDPYNMRSEPIVRAGHTWRGTVTARWFNIIVRGSRYHITGLQFDGYTRGRT